MSLLKLTSFILFILLGSLKCFSAELANDKLTKSQVKAAQSALNNLGFNAGSVDGALGNKTRTAYKNFATEFGFNDDSDFSENEVALLRAVSFNVLKPSSLSNLQLTSEGWAINLNDKKVLDQRKILEDGYRHRWYGRGVLWREHCVDILSATNENSQKIAAGTFDDQGGPLGIHGCLEGMGNIVSFSNDFKPIADVLINLSSSDYQTYEGKDFNGFYNAVSVVTILAAHYAIFYEEYVLSDQDRLSIDNFLVRSLQVDIDQSRSTYSLNRVVACDKSNFELFGYNDDQVKGGWIDNNTCGSLRWKLANAQLALSLRLKDKTLFELAKYNTQRMLDLFDENNIFVTWAAQSGLAVSYSKDVPNMLGLQSELYRSIGFDLLDHKGDNGNSVADYMKTYWLLWKDNKAFKETQMYLYAQRPKRENEKHVDEIANETMQTLFWDNDTHAPTLARWMKGYALRFEPELLAKAEDGFFRDAIRSRMNNIIHSFNIVDTELLRLAIGD